MDLELRLKNAPVSFLSQLRWKTVPSFRGVVAESPPTMSVTPPCVEFQDHCSIRID